MSNRVLLVIIAAIVVALGALIIFGDNASDSTARSDNKIGTSEKNVVLMEAYSLACPGCASYHPFLKQLREEYSDKVVFQVVHYPLTAKPGFKNARAAHRAVEAASRQGKFWEMHDILFEKHDLWVSELNDPVPQIETFAEELGLDVEQFRKDFRSKEINDIINNDEEYLRGELGVSSTPTFFLNGQRLDNHRDFPADENNRELSLEKMRQLLNEALGETAEETPAAGAPATTPENNENTNSIGEDEQPAIEQPTPEQ